MEKRACVITVLSFIIGKEHKTHFCILLNHAFSWVEGEGLKFIDEPVLGLDANHRELFYWVLLEKYAEHPFTAVISTHLIDELAGLVENVILLRRGQVLYNGSREELLDQGYTVSGKAADVDRYKEGRPLIGEERLGGLKAAYFWGEPAPAPEGLEVSPLDLQKLFIRLTEEEEER